jgi:streptogramin lyase
VRRLLFILPIAIAPALSAQVLSVSTLAGTTNGGGYLDARGTAARFSDPVGVAADAAGNVFVADSSNQVIRKIAPNGDVTTFAGTPHLAGNADGKPGLFNFPAAVAVDRATNVVYVADTFNSTIRKITPDGVVGTLAAGLHHPLGIAVASDGTIYVADTDADAVVRVTSGGAVTTLGTFAAAGPAAIAVDAGGTLYVAGFRNDTIYKWPAGGTATPLVKPGAGIVGSRGLAVDANGTLAASDYYTNRICRVAPDGTVTRLAGSVTASPLVDGSGDSARFLGPAGIAFDGAGSLFIADEFNQAIRRMTPSRDVTTFAGLAPTAGELTFPLSVAADSAGNVYVVDSTSALKKLAPTGAVTAVADGFAEPRGIAVDRRDGSIVVADTGDHTILRVTAQGIVTTIAGRSGTLGFSNGVGTSATFNNPHGVAVDGSGTIYVADTFNGAVRKIAPDGVVTTFAKSLGSVTSIAIDPAGALYVAEGFNGVIDRITPDGVASKFAGNGQSGWRDAIGTAAVFNEPFAIALDARGDLYVADAGNAVIRRVTPSGDVTTVGGAGLRTGNVNGFGAAARFSGPIGIALLPDGRLAIADSDNHAIRVANIVAAGKPRAVRH